LRSTLEYLSISAGPGAVAMDNRFWKYGGWLVVGVLLLTGLLLIVAYWKQPRERLRTVGLLALLAAMTVLAFGIGWGRSGFGPRAALMGRYATLAVLTPCGCYLAWLLYSPPALAGLAEMCLFTSVVLFFVPNMQAGKEHGRELRQTMQAFENDVRAGEPPYRLARRYAPDLFPRPTIKNYMPLLKRAGIGVFRDLRDDPPLQKVPLQLASAQAHGMSWHEGTARGTGFDSYLVFTLPEPRYVAAIRLTFTHSNAWGDFPILVMYWKTGDQAGFPDVAGFYDRIWRTGPVANFFDGSSDTEPRPQTLIIGVDEVIDSIRLHPDQLPFTFKIAEFVLLVPESRPPAIRGVSSRP
jgi:hypothetical protein